MSKLMRNKTLMRFTAFLLAFCCLFSMAPPAFAADDVEATAEGDSEYRYIWLISQPGFGIRITRGPNDQPRVQVSDMELAQYPLTGTPWMDCKLITSPTTGEQVYVLDGDKIPADADNTSWGTRPSATDGIGYLRMYTNFDNVVLPDTSIPNWEGTEFAYVNNQTRPFDPNQITADDGGKQYWAGNISGGDTFNIGKDYTSWSTMVDDMYKYAPISCDPEDGRYMPSPIDVRPVYDLNPDDTYYFAQIQIPIEVVNDYIKMHDGNFMGEGSNTDSRFTVANNTMFQFISQNELPIPDISDIGTVIFDFNLPGTDAEVKYLRQAGTMVDVPPISTQDVQGVTFRFKGWFTEAEGGTQITDAQVEVPGGGYQVYYAQWELIDNGGGDGQIGEGDMYVAYFDYNIEGAGVTSAYCAAGEFTWSVTVDGETETYTAVLPFQFPEDPYRVGYKFLGWATTPQATSPDVDPDTWLPTKDDNTVYGVWEAQPYTLTWNANGGAPNTTTQQRYNEEIVPPNTEPTREGYTFGGWYLDRNCTVPLASGTKVTGNQVFYAKWMSERVVVNYYDTRQGTALVTTQEYNYGDKLNLLGPIENTDGWHFQSWQTADGKEASSIVILDDSVLTYRKGGNGSDVSSDAGYWVLDLYALWAQDTAKFAATVRWDDFQNNDGCRPQSVKLGLVSSINDELVREATVTNDGNDTQTYTFTDLPITTSDSSVEKITYKLIFLGWTDSDGVYREIHDTEASSGEIEGSSGSDYDDTVSTVYKYAINNYVTGYAGYIKLDHNLITTGDDIAFTIQWDDASDNDGKRPGAVMLVLYADGVPVYQKPLHNSGTGVQSVSAANCQVTDDGDTWTYIFKDYQKYNNGKAIEYTVAVKNDDLTTTFNGEGYTTKYLDGNDNVAGHENGAIISRPVELTDKTVTIHWDDESNRDNLRPESVDVQLTAYQWNNKTFRWEEVEVTTATVSGGAENDTWTHTFEDVKKYNGGQEIIYRATIISDLNAHIPDGANGYTFTTKELDITVSHNRNVKSLPVTIEWDDKQNNDKIRPSTVIVQLYADGVKLEGAEYAKLLTGDLTADTWEYTFENLPVYREGNEGEEILYTISVEEAVEDSLYGTYFSMANGQEEELVRYTASYMSADGETTDDLTQSAYPYAKLTHATDQGTINIYASWHDEQNRDGKRPSSIQVDLYKQVDGEREFIQTYTVTAGRDNSWTYKVSGLSLMENGHEVTYLVDVSEDFRQNLQENYGYTVSMEGSTVHLYYTPAVGYVTGHINWQDNNDNDNLRPDSVKGTLYANGEPTDQVLEFNAANNWTQTWQDVASYYNNNGATGTPVQYSIVVETPDGYTVTYTPETTTTIEPHDIQIDLTHETDQQALDATVYWNDNGDQDGVRPDSVEIQLYANGEKVVGKTAIVTGEGDTWTTSFSGLDKYQDGELIDYTIGLNDNTGRTYESLTAGMNLYLSYDAQRADMTVAFRFDDADNADGVRPEALYLTLTADGVEVAEADYQRTVYFDVDGVSWTFKNLPVYSTEGTRIKYNASVELDPEFGATDYEIVTSNDITLSTNGNTNQVVVTLKRGTNTGAETGNIYWFDNNNQRGNRPETLTIDVRSDASSNVVGTYTIDSVNKTVTDRSGKVVGGVTVSEWGTDGSSCWTYTIEGLPQNAVYDGVSREIFYSATARQTGIAAWYNVLDGESLDINLTHKNYEDDIGASQQDFNITVSWMDNENAWNYRPNTNGVDVQLLANGTEYQTIHLTQADVSKENSNAWTYKFTDLPTYLNGSAVVWTAQITDVDKYTAVVSNHSNYATITMTQSIGFDFTVNWDDSDDDDAVRPDSVTVDVYGDGTKVGAVTLTGDGNTWTGSIKDLAVWRTTGTTIPVSYSFRWSEETAAAMLDEGYIASATQNGEPVEADTFYWVSATEWGAIDGGLDDLTGQYQWETTITRNKETMTVYADILWDDDGNRDGLRPTEILVQLYANGEPVGEAKKLTGSSTESSWPISWTEQDVYDGGKPINYTIEVVSVPNGYTASTDASGLNVTLTHTPETISVTGTVNWDDSSEAHYEYDDYGDVMRSWYGIERTDVWMQLLVNGQPIGEPLFIPASGYKQEDGSMATYAAYTWDNLYVHENEGETNVYTINVYSDDLTALLNDGYTQTYDFTTDPYGPSTTIQHTYYDVRGTVYYLYDTSDDYLLEGVPVTAYLLDEETNTYTAVGSAITDENGNYEIKNIPQGMLTVRATYDYGDYTYAGSVGVRLNLCDQNDVDIIVNRDAGSDSDLYRYSASGHTYYQTDVTDDSTKAPVPKGSVVLLYKVVDGESSAQYVGMTTTDGEGAYHFDTLESGTYLVNVVFNYNDGTYTYDNDDAQADGLSFLISGADATWPDIVKQVNADVDPGDPDPPVDPEEPEPEPEPVPCVVDGSVYFSDNGVHTTDPVEGVDVYVYSESGNTLVGQATTDADGHWVIEGVSAGNYIGVFSYAGNASRVLHFTVSESDYETGTYTAATQYFDRNSQISTATIRGVVLDENGSQNAALVQILNEDGEIVDIAYTDDAGMYNFTVQSGFTYRVKILAVGTQTEYLTAGDPDDDLTALDYYTVSGNFSIDGAAQSGATVALYKQNGESFDLKTATLTDGNGDYTIKVTDAGNYRISMYRNGEIYSNHFVSVGYQEYEPVVTDNGGTYTITGSEPNGFDSGVLYNTTTDVVRVVEELSAGSNYSIDGLSAGTYRLELTKDGATTIYYIDAPDNAVEVNYYVTVSGRVVNEAGQPMLGAIVTLLDSEGQQVGEQTIITDGGFSYEELPADTYQVKIDYPVTGEQLLDRTTEETDSYGMSYPGGMTPGSVWSWNLNATTVSGSVKDQDGTPVAGATVVLRLNSDPDKAYGVMTDEDGNWTAGVMAGEYTVSAMFEFDANHIYHSTEDLTVPVSNDDVDGVDLTINRYTVTGTVVREGDNQPIEGAEVTVSLEDGTPYWTGTTGEDGKFLIPAFPDSYKVEATYEDQYASTTITVADDMDVTLAVGVPIVISGTVYDADGNVVPDGIVYYDGAASGRTFTDDDGKYAIAISAAQTGSYTLYAEAAGMTSEKVTINVTTDTTQDLTLNKHGTDPDPSGDRLLSGVVVDNEGRRLANAIVTLTYGNDKTETLETSTSSDGTFRFADLADGTYYLTAVYEAPNGNSYATNGETTVHINGEDVTDVVLAVSLSYDVEVSVKDTSGDPIEGATVSYDGASSGEVLTDASGKAEINLAGGSYVFKATIGNRESNSKTVIVDKATSVDLVVGTTGILYEEPDVESHAHTISGYVIDPNNNPVKGADVTLLKFINNRWTEVDGTKSAQNGYYEFANLDGGRYRVEITYTQSNTVTTEVGTYTISGYALDDTENPYVGATVNLYTLADDTVLQTVHTDKSGYYEFTGLTLDDYRVQIIPAEDPSRAWTEEKTAEAGSAIIDGVVTDVNGDPVNGATVVVSGTGGSWSMTTRSDGAYSFEVPRSGDYTVTITYPDSYDVFTDGSYENDPSDPIKPTLVSDDFTIFGYVHDTDENIIVGATVILQNEAGTQIDETLSNENGYYEFTGLKPGIYTVIVRHEGNEQQYKVDTDNAGSTDPGDPEEPPVGKIEITGSVVTNHKRPLAGAAITVRNMDTGDTVTLTADKDGLFDTGELDSGRYELIASYTHKYGTSSSDPLHTTISHDDVVMVIILSYVADVNGDGEDETVFAGEDDEFDTEDDFYQYDMDGDGIKEDIFAGEDKTPGTKDDWYGYDVNHDGDNEQVFVGDDRIPGTEDDYYLADPDKDGEDEPIYAGEDGIPGTKDDWYPSDPDKDGEDEVIHVGEDTQPGTPDDWYESDPDKDGEDEQVFVGDDGIPGTDDDWYYDDDGNPTPIGEVKIRFNANGGTVNGESVYTIAQSELRRLPTATRSDYDFDGWFTAASGGTKLTLADITAFPITTTVYAHWTESGGSNPGGGEGGNGSGGGGGGGGGGAVLPPEDDGFTVTIDETQGADIDPVGEQQVDEGDDLTVTIKPEDGYTIEDVLVDGESVGVVDEYTFKDIDSDHTLKVVVRPVDMLTDEHISYVGGYPDGTVRPDANISRAEVAMIFYRLLTDDARAAYESSDSTFTDVADGAWYTTAIATLSNAGIITGDPKGTYRPNDIITRAEFAAIAARFDKSDISGTASFTDISGHWARELIERAAARGWVNGYSDGTFRPNVAITRAEAMTLINRVLGRDTLTADSLLDGMKTWPDNAPSAWYYLAVQEATNGHDCVMENGVEVWTLLK